MPTSITSNSESLSFTEAFELINPHLYTVEERIRAQAKSFDPAVEGYVSYICGAGGKRLRPALALLSAGATGKITPGHVDLAVILELIHIATLVHDDIIDGAELRREQSSANAKWGNAISVLLGDVLFAHALRLSTKFSNSDVSRRIADAAALAAKNGIEPHAGHGLTFDNVQPIAAIPQFAELNIGHYLIGEAIFIGLEESVRKMRTLMDLAR
jgi:hypothetical protein